MWRMRCEGESSVCACLGRPLEMEESPFQLPVLEVRDNSKNYSNGSLFSLQQPLSYRDSVKHSSSSSVLHSECKSKPGVNGGPSPRNKSHLDKVPHTLLSPLLSALIKTQHHVAGSGSNVSQNSELFRVDSYLASGNENVSSGSSTFNLLHNYSQDILNSSPCQCLNDTQEGSRLSSQILLRGLEAVERAASCVDCRELRCPQTCTNWKAHCLQRTRKLSAPTTHHSALIDPCSSSLSVLPPSSQHQKHNDENKARGINHDSHLVVGSNYSKIPHKSGDSFHLIDNRNNYTGRERPLLTDNHLPDSGIEGQQIVLSHRPVRSVSCHSRLGHVKSVQNIFCELAGDTLKAHYTPASSPSYNWRNSHHTQQTAALDSCKSPQRGKKNRHCRPDSHPESLPPLKSPPGSPANPWLGEANLSARSSKKNAGSSKSGKQLPPTILSNMAKGYVKALAEQINHNGPLISGNTSDEEEGDGAVSVQDIVTRINRSNSEAGLVTSPLSSKDSTSKDAHTTGALHASALKNLCSPKNAADSCVTKEVEIKNDLFQHLKKAAERKQQGSTQYSAEHKTSPLHSQTKNRIKTSPSPTQHKKFGSECESSNNPHNSHTQKLSNYDSVDSAVHKFNEKNSSHTLSQSKPLHRKISAPSHWSPSTKGEKHFSVAGPESSPPSSSPKTSPKPRPPVDYSRKPSLDYTKMPASLSLKRPSLPAQDVVFNCSQVSPTHRQKQTSTPTSPISLSASSTPSSPPLLSPSSLPSCPSSHSPSKSTEPAGKLGEASNKLNTYTDITCSRASSEKSAVPAISVVSPADNTRKLEPAASDRDPLTLGTSSEPIRLRSSPSRAISEYRESVLKTIYDNGPPLTAEELFDSSWSDSDSFGNDDEDECDCRGEGQREDADTVTPLSSPVKSPAEKQADSDNKRQHIVQEMLKTERDYVARLHLLHHVFYFRLDKENRQHAFLPGDTLKHMFSNIKSIYLFHHDFLLQQMEEKVKSWDQDPRIGDLLKKNAPFLKMYSEYIGNFDNAMKLIDQWTKKSSKFSNIIKTVQELPECGNLSLQHHMLEPIQRVPRYEMLIKDYVKHLPEDSPDMKDATDALNLVTIAACHSNGAMKKIESFQKLLEIYQTLKGVPLDFISPTREFVTQGPVIKIAARSGEKLPRQLFMFNDLLLVCNQYNALLGTFNVRSQLEMDSVEIKPGNNMNIPNTFRVHSKQKAVELLDEDQNGVGFEWEKKIKEQLALFKTRKRSIIQEDNNDFVYEPSMPDSWVGKTAPVWIPDDAATMCMLCELVFNMMRRRHHCRACGKLICKSCSKKAPLQYNKGKIERVCVVCYDIIVNKQTAYSFDHTDKKKGVLQVKASEPSLMSGYVQCSEDSGNSWHRMWITAHKDFVLYSFKAHEDVSAISCLPLPGHEVKQVWDVEGRPHVFSLTHKHRVVSMYQPQNDKQLKKWMAVVAKLVQAELPDETQRQSTNSNNSNASVSSDGDSAFNSVGNRNSGAIATTSVSASSTTITSNGSGSSQADSGCPGDDGGDAVNGAAGLGVHDPDQDIHQDHLAVGKPVLADHEDADKISQYDNVEAVISESHA